MLAEFADGTDGYRVAREEPFVKVRVIADAIVVARGECYNEALALATVGYRVLERPNLNIG